MQTVCITNYLLLSNLTDGYDVRLDSLLMGSSTLSPSVVYNRVGARIRDERERRNFSQEMLANRVGLTRTSITNIEKGRQKVLLHTLLEIARVLNLKPTRLLPDLSRLSEIDVPPDVSKKISRWIERSLEETK